MPLFRDIEDFASAYPALESVEWPMLEPLVDRVERATLRDQVLGQELYDELLAAATAFHANPLTTMTARLQALYDRSRPFVANMAGINAIKKFNVLFTSGGMQSLPQEKRAAMWQVRQRLAQDLDDAYTDLNLLIGLLIANEATDYNGWRTASSVGREIRESLVPTMKEAGRFMRLHGPWLLHQLRPAMRQVQNGPVKGILGEADLTTLLTNLHDPAHTLTADELAQLEEIQPAILHGALADQMAALSLVVDEHGVWTWKAANSGGQISAGEQPADGARLTGLIRDHQSKSAGHLEKLRALINPTDSTAGYRRIDPDGGGPITMMG